MSMIRLSYERFILPYLLDFVCRQKTFHTQRKRVVARAKGTVLEVGIGTGLNLEYYDTSNVTVIIGLDPALQEHRLMQRRRQRISIPLTLIGLSAEKIPLEDSCVDSIVMTYTLCSIPDPVSALHEMRRVLKPGGSLFFSEHGRAPEKSIHRWQDYICPFWKIIAGGCHPNRDVVELLQQTGWNLQEVTSAYLPGPRVFSYHSWGVATSS